MYGLPLDEKQLEIFNILTKGEGKYKLGSEKLEGVMCLGTRSGKSLLASIIAIYEATRRKWAQFRSPGEPGYIVVVSTRQKQSEQIIGANCLRLMENSRNLRGLIKDSTMSELTLRTNMKILSLPCNSTAGRGLPIAVLILDEIAFFRLEGVKADEIIYNSLRPRQSQFPDSKMLMLSTAGSRQGLFYQFFSEGFKIEDRLTIQAETRFVNPEIPQKFIDKEFARNPENANREFKAIFAEKVEAFFTRELLDKVILLAGDLEYNPKNTYVLGIDQSGLSDRDLFGLTIAHKEKEKEGERVITDLVRSYKTKDFDYILSNIKDFIKQYNLSSASIDRFAKGYVENSLTKLGLKVEIRPDLATVFLNLKALILNQKISLPDNSELKEGLLNTQAYYNKQNAINITHERSILGHSDLADSLATCVYLLKPGGESDSSHIWWLDNKPKPLTREEWLNSDDDEEIGSGLPDYYGQIE